jgi:AraC-like DNA-binding protein
MHLKPNKNEELIRKVFEFIKLNCRENIKLKEVAQEVGYSSAYLTDLVRKLTGKTVNSWIIEYRIAEASTLLLETDYSVEEIASRVGYQSINHFYHQFRNHYKNTPGFWRKAQH